MKQGEELKIGNFMVFQMPDGSKLTKRVDAFDIMSVSKETESVDYYTGSKVVAHIKLNEKWIKELGLENKIINGFMVKKGTYKGRDYSLFFCISDEVEPIEMCAIRSVAHCQNLFYELTGHKS